MDTVSSTGNLGLATIATGSLAERLRPLLFAEVIGQEATCAVLRGQARPEELTDDWGRLLRGGRSVLLHGPAGCGKTSLARIYANALICQGGDGEPCLTCRDCDDWRAGRYPNLRGGEAKGQDDLAFAKDLRRQADAESSGGGWLVFLLEEPQWLSDRALDLLQDDIGRERPRVTYILCTTQPDRIPPPLRDRLQELSIAPLGMAARTELLRRAVQTVTGLVSTADEAAVIDLLARAGDGVPRRMLSALEHLALSGGVTPARVRAHYRLDAAHPAARYLTALVAGEGLGAQMRALDAWDVEPADKLGGVQRLLGELFSGDILRLDRPGLLAEVLPARTSLVAALNVRADRLGLAPRALWCAMLDVWHPRKDATDAELLATVVSFDAFLAGEGGAVAAGSPVRVAVPGVIVGTRQPQHPTHAPQPARARGRSPMKARSADPARLSLTDVQVLWDAASFLIQDRGLYLNTRLTLRHDRLGVVEKAVGPFVTKLAHEMRMRVDRLADRAGAKTLFHFLFVHELGHPDGPCTHLIATLPDAAACQGDDAARNVATWLRDAYLPRKCNRPCSPGAFVLRHWRDQKERRFARHLQLLRLLCRGLDPQIAVVRDTDGAPTPLIDIIGVRRCLQGPIGRRLGKQRQGASRQIDSQARAAVSARDGLRVLSVFEEERWAALTTDWESAEHAFRRRLRSARVAGEGSISALWPAGERLLDRQHRDAALLAFRTVWSEHVREREQLRPGLPSGGTPAEALLSPD